MEDKFGDPQKAQAKESTWFLSTEFSDVFVKF